MNRTLQFILWSLLGTFLLICGLLVPAHFRALDVNVLEHAGQGTPSLVDLGFTFVNLEKLGPARMAWTIAMNNKLNGHEDLQKAIARFPTQATSPRTSGLVPKVTDVLQPLDPRPVGEILVNRAARSSLAEVLQTSRRPGVQEIFRTRLLTNTVNIPPAMSPAGQPLDSVILTLAAASQADVLSQSLREQFESLAREANRGKIEPYENACLDLLGLLKRLDWSQISELFRVINNVPDLRVLAEKARNENRFPLIYTGILMASQPTTLVKYLNTFGETGLNDVQTAVLYNKGALNELLERQQPIYRPGWRNKAIAYEPFASMFYALMPLVKNYPLGALVLRLILLLFGALCLGRALGTLMLAPAIVPDGVADRSRFVQETVLGICLLAVVICAMEPNLISTKNKSTLPFRVKLPGTGSTGAVAPTKPMNNMSQNALIPLLVFFILQALLYIWSLTKLSEIRRQAVEARVKLKLLENEDHLFDAGLYVGFAGTVISLIMVSLGIISQSIMAAYGSTSFGIIFVSILKIFHIRPFRRELILESENYEQPQS